ITLNGCDITHEGVRERSLAGISYIPEDRQEVGLVLDLNLAENLALKKYFQNPFCKKGVLKYDVFSEYGKRLIETYDIRSGQGVLASVRSMSGGNQQKAIVAREIEQASRLMIFVQPTRGLDIGAIENIHKQILAQRDAGRAILLISLELDEIMNLADTIGVMFNGKMQKIAPAETLDANTVGEFMMGVKSE
ncbi:MAG: heme ABC transporter ATP-binding protein, partial [Oscillospiraceae bacterium]